jgi:predicted ATPase/transcriptional regulator with XRE-family HTH domain
MDGDVSFGAWVRRRRRALDLTQADLARLASCATVMVRMIEADERRPSRELAERLADHLQLPPADRAAFIRSARAERRVEALSAPVPLAGPVRAPAPLWVAPLPALATPLVGREREVAVVRQWLLQPATRLLTLTGTGGVGKTRLALQVAAELRDAGAFADGVVFVALEAVRDPGLVLATIARALGIIVVDGQALIERLKAELHAKHLLLMLDNFEQVGAAAPLLADVLAAAPRLTLLVTSRVVLRLSAEQEYLVPPLRLPDPARLPPVDELAQTEAVALFVQRAKASTPAFALTAENAAAVAAICARLDGLPLAIELAAARVKLFTPEALLPRLERRLQVLTGGARDLPLRQQTLRDTLAWSHGLLTPAEQLLFRCLAVFAGGCTIEAAERVCGEAASPGLDILTGLAALVDQSLVQSDAGAAGEPRFRLLETVREYGLERLAASGEAAVVRRWHAEFYLELAEAAEPHLQGAVQRTWLARLEIEHDNLRAALGWCLEEAGAAAAEAAEQTEISLRLAGALAWFWHTHGHHSEGRRWLERALAADRGAPPAARAKALVGLGTLVLPHGDNAWATARLEEGLALFRQVGDQRGIAWALHELGVAARFRGDYQLAVELLGEGLALSRGVENRWVMAQALHELGIAVRNRGDYERASTHMAESLELFRQLGDQRGIAWAVRELAVTARGRGAYDQAASLLEEALLITREIGDTWGIARMLQDLGIVERLRGNGARAMELVEAGQPLLGDVGDARAMARGFVELGLAARSQGDARWAMLVAEGLGQIRNLGDRRNVAVVLEQLAAVACADGRPEQAARLLGAAEALREAMGARLPPAEQAAHATTEQAARAALGEAAFAAARAAGRFLTPVAAVDEALAGVRETSA